MSVFYSISIKTSVLKYHERSQGNRLPGDSSFADFLISSFEG